MKKFRRYIKFYLSVYFLKFVSFFLSKIKFYILPNFSKEYLPSKIGGLMDAPLLIQPVVIPKEVQRQARNLDIMSSYPREFYNQTEKHAIPNTLNIGMKTTNEFILPVTLAFLVLFQLSNYTKSSKCISIPPTIEKMRNIMKTKEFVLLLSTLLIMNCAGTAPSVGEEISNQESTESDTKVVEEEVKVEIFTVQEPEAPPLPVTVFEPYMIKRGDYLIKIASREYGDSSRWREIYEWNREEIGSNPNKIYPYNFLSLKREASKAKNCDLEFFDYQIQSGDTAWGLADEIYGDELAWVIIYMDNERLIRNNDGVLQPGTIFKMRKKLDPCS